MPAPPVLLPTPRAHPLVPALTAPAAGGLPPIVELARHICPILRRWAYDWSLAIVETTGDLWQVASAAPDHWLVVHAPLVAGVLSRLNAQGFVFELVQDARTADWRMAYATGGRLHELSTGQRQAAGAFLRARVTGGEVVSYWQ